MVSLFLSFLGLSFSARAIASQGGRTTYCIYLKEERLDGLPGALYSCEVTAPSSSTPSLPSSIPSSESKELYPEADGPSTTSSPLGTGVAKEEGREEGRGGAPEDLLQQHLHHYNPQPALSPPPLPQHIHEHQQLQQPPAYMQQQPPQPPQPQSMGHYRPHPQPLSAQGYHSSFPPSCPPHGLNYASPENASYLPPSVKLSFNYKN
ncbi:hypothetical protein NGA_0691300, partial [Nannochloropsis gaditana CCMP526]|uniref:uncharacterized protein n=1 Tax=Nannochloropsis gaditana (strain CCMP526) TaxID=1093141 RepID=UPI00029F61A6